MTELPWKNERGCICEKNGHGLASVFWIEDAEYIVKACNLFPELVEALEELIGAEWMVTHDWGGDRDDLLEKIRELLIKAKQ